MNKMKKIPTIFKRNPENMKLVLNEINPVCQWVFDGEGIATKKYDGTCCMILNGLFYKRRELKSTDIVPEDFKIEDFDPNTGKFFGWVPVSQTDQADKYHREAFSSDLLDGTYELIGEKVQGNPEKVKGHKLIKHADALELYPMRTFEGIKKALEMADIEGFVFHHPDGRMGKIKKRDFGFIRS